MLTSRRTNSSSDAQQLGEAELAVDMTRRLDVVLHPDLSVSDSSTPPSSRIVLMVSSARISNGSTGIVGLCSLDWIRGGRGLRTHTRECGCNLGRVIERLTGDACDGCCIVPMSPESVQQANASDTSTEPKRVGHESKNSLSPEPGSGRGVPNCCQHGVLIHTRDGCLCCIRLCLPEPSSTFCSRLLVHPRRRHSFRGSRFLLVHATGFPVLPHSSSHFLLMLDAPWESLFPAMKM